MSVLVVGSVALDSIETPFGGVQDVLGGSASYFSLAASLFTDVKIVAIVGDDFPEEYIGLFKSKGIEEYLMKNAGQVVTRTMLLENVWDYHFESLGTYL